MSEFLSAILGGLISPLVLAVLNQRIIWRARKRVEFKKLAFDDAIEALSMFEADALNPELQQSSRASGSLRPITKLRNETRDKIQKSLAMVEAFFKAETSKAFQSALSSSLSLDTNPNQDHALRRTQAIRAMADELELARPWWQISEG